MSISMKCPVPSGHTECGKEEILAKKKKEVIRKPDGSFVTHHECQVHKFHIKFPGGAYEPCECSI